MTDSVFTSNSTLFTYPTQHFPIPPPLPFPHFAGGMNKQPLARIEAYLSPMPCHKVSGAVIQIHPYKYVMPMFWSGHQ